jgi:fatty acid desaturase
MQADTTEYPIPEVLNIAILCLVLPLLWCLLWLASHASWPIVLFAAWIFTLLNHVPFSLLHEAVHGIFSKNPFRNDLFGVLAAAAFPTSFTMQQIAHLGHHRRNRTDQELYDYYLPHQSKSLRNFQLYSGNLFGLYWFCIPLSNLIYLFLPWLYKSEWFIKNIASNLGFEPYVREIAQHSLLRIWLECLLALVYQVAVFFLLDLSLQGWLLCHWFFALHWSALQYVDHAWSPRDIVNGAWNLKVTPPARLLALNYHYHLAHHRQPGVPWLYLPQRVNKNEPQPSFWSIYFSLWGGVKPAPPMLAGNSASFAAIQEPANQTGQ